MDYVTVEKSVKGSIRSVHPFLIGELEKIILPLHYFICDIIFNEVLAQLLYFYYS
jgi:hypothetical protein